MGKGVLEVLVPARVIVHIRKEEFAVKEFMDDQKKFFGVHTGSRIAGGDGYDRGKSVGSAVNLTQHSFENGAAAKAGQLLAGC